MSALCTVISAGRVAENSKLRALRPSLPLRLVIGMVPIGMVSSARMSLNSARTFLRLFNLFHTQIDRLCGGVDKHSQSHEGAGVDCVWPR
jgi:hypothetical protein